MKTVNQRRMEIQKEKDKILAENDAEKKVKKFIFYAISFFIRE